MRKHNKSFHIRLTQDEYDRLRKQSEKAGLPKSTYIRFMIKGQIPQDKIMPDYWQMKQELYRIGNNQNQLTMTAHAKGWLHEKRLKKILDEFHSVLLKLSNDTIPVKADTSGILKRASDMEQEVNYADVL